MADLLPWVADINGMESYQATLEKCIGDTRIAETDPPETLEKNTALIELVLPEEERYSDGYWVLYMKNAEPDRAGEEAGKLQEEDGRDGPETEYYMAYGAGEGNRTIRAVVTTGEKVYFIGHDCARRNHEVIFISKTAEENGFTCVL